MDAWKRLRLASRLPIQLTQTGTIIQAIISLFMLARYRAYNLDSSFAMQLALSALQGKYGKIKST